MALLIPGLTCAGEDDAKKLSAQLPLIFWHTGELWGKLERGASTGESSEDFVKSMKTKFSRMDESKASPESWKFHLYYSEDEGKEETEGWIFILNHDGKAWSEVSAVRITGGSTFQLLEADIFSPSMRPQLRQTLDLYNSGKLAETVAKLSAPGGAGDAGDTPAAPEYAALLGEGLSGSGFHFAIGDKRYIACSLHQFEGKAPAVMGSMDFDDPIKIVKRVYAGKDIQVLAYVSADLDKKAPLKFDEKVTPAVGDKVYCYDFEDSYEGEIVSIAPDNRSYSVKMSKAYPAGGNSGSPVVSAATGTAVGVLLTANDAEAATTVGFELLRPEKKAP